MLLSVEVINYSSAELFSYACLPGVLKGLRF